MGAAESSPSFAADFVSESCSFRKPYSQATPALVSDGGRADRPERVRSGSDIRQRPNEGNSCFAISSSRLLLPFPHAISVGPASRIPQEHGPHLKSCFLSFGALCQILGPTGSTAGDAVCRELQLCRVAHTRVLRKGKRRDLPSSGHVVRVCYQQSGRCLSNSRPPGFLQTDRSSHP